ncbi:uncharacterized protein LOC129736912 [Falco cherrug]|uniref:uncharacterized protein LOC129736912 n=1 Tax=Falco cherrug TaxID=345164 RepID=UPI00247AE7D9|nr:uncharacterized protein LOC129736912 [Falco cherrug]
MSGGGALKIAGPAEGGEGRETGLRSLRERGAGRAGWAPGRGHRIPHSGGAPRSRFPPPPRFGWGLIALRAGDEEEGAWGEGCRLCQVPPRQKVSRSPQARRYGEIEGEGSGDGPAQPAPAAGARHRGSRGRQLRCAVRTAAGHPRAPGPEGAARSSRGAARHSQGRAQPTEAPPRLEEVAGGTQAWPKDQRSQPQEPREHLLQGTTSSPWVTSVAADVGEMQEAEANESSVSKVEALPGALDAPAPRCPLLGALRCP